MNKVIVFFVIFFLILTSFEGEDETSNESKVISKFKSLNNKEKGAFFYELNSKTFVFNAHVTLKGYFDPFDSKKDWFALLNASSFFLPIYYYIDGNFYYIDLNSKKISCIQNCSYKIVITNDTEECTFVIFPNKNLIDERILINLYRIDKNDLNNIDMKNEYKLSVETIQKDCKINLKIKDNYIQELEALTYGNELPILSYKEILDKKEIEKINNIKDILVKYVEQLKLTNQLEIIKKETFDMQVYFENIRILGSFISVYNNSFSTKKIPKAIELVNKDLYKINLDTYLENFKHIYFNFLKFQKDNNTYLLWNELSISILF